MSGRRVSELPDESRSRLAHLLRSVRVELLPLPGALDQSTHLAPGTQVAVTADPVQGMEPTIALSVELARRGFDVVPHLSAQLTRDRAELAAYLDRLHAAAITEALVVGGVADPPGDFFDAAALLDAIDSVGSPFHRIGLGGYPEGHHVLADELVEEALRAKAPRADWITTQICFSPAKTGTWIERLRADSIALPIWLGIPAVTDMTGLMSLGLRVGAGRSLQFMFEHPRLVTRMLRPGGSKATQLVVDLSDMAANDALGIAGFHLFTYNQVAASERWRRRLLADLS